VESPTQRSKPARATGTSARRTQAAAARQRNRNAAPAERAAAAAAAQYEAKLGYRAMPSSTTLRTGASPLDTSQSVNIVPEQVIKDQLPCNIDDALVNIRHEMNESGKCLKTLERVKGIEPSYSAWKASEHG
jgi:iron complex outermembrane receptor protein